MRELSLELRPRLEAGHEARQVLSERFAADLTTPVSETLKAVVTELVNNAVQHGPGEPIELRIAVKDDGSVRGQVRDQGHAQIAIRDMNDETGGLGLPHRRRPYRSSLGGPSGQHHRVVRDLAAVSGGSRRY
jgi:anti-sigma regulatory factor (Ser/Thr protein kinase)